MYQTIKLPDVVISSGSSASSAISADGRFQHAEAVAIGCPAILPENCNVQVSLDDGSTYHVLQSGGSDVLLTAGKAVVISMQAFTHIKLATTGGNVAGNRTFKLTAVEKV